MGTHGTLRTTCHILKSLEEIVFFLGMKFHFIHSSTTHLSIHSFTHLCEKHVAHKPLVCSCPSKAPISCSSPMRENK